MATLQVRPNLSAPALRFSAVKLQLHHLRLPAQRQGSLGIAGGGQQRRGWSVVRKAGPSSSSYAFAFALPLGLIIFTVFTSIRVSDKLDKEYMEELELNRAIMEAEGIELPEEEDEEFEEEGDEVSPAEVQELPQPALSGSRIRNRPKREV